MNFKNITTGTWARIITLFVLLVNQVAISIFGITLLPFDDVEIYEGVSTVLTVISSSVAGWKNNSVTKEAQEADAVLKAKKAVK